jgi:hypothetical protein
MINLSGRTIVYPTPSLQDPVPVYLYRTQHFSRSQRAVEECASFATVTRMTLNIRPRRREAAILR